MIKKMFFILLQLVLSGVVFSQTTAGITTLQQRTNEFANCLYSLLPPISMLLVIAAAVTYAAGQLASAETRARATGWATAMIVGALFGFVLVALFPSIINALYGQSITLSPSCTLF
ncbi:MAG: hypothetical protein QXV83_03795 [Candidatus Anstonellaceae archaeon]